MEQWHDISGQALALLPDGIFPTDSQETSPSLLTAMRPALQRIAKLMHRLHQPASSPETKPLKPGLKVMMKPHDFQPGSAMNSGRLMPALFNTVSNFPWEG
ncbi:MAG: hypothetical protein PHG00_15370 [Methylococcales bacterium]|nr:hypothetical protein [Methylococcales bacterium]